MQTTNTLTAAQIESTALWIELHHTIRALRSCQMKCQNERASLDAEYAIQSATETLRKYERIA